MVIVLAHWGEHLLQAFQIYGLGWPRAGSARRARHFFPVLVTSEMLHYGYALVMLVGLWVLRRASPASTIAGGGRSRSASSSSTTSSTRCCRTQALVGHNLFDRPVPTSLVQLWVPRVELHLFYNTIVFIPMVVARCRRLKPPCGDGALRRPVAVGLTFGWLLWSARGRAVRAG